MTLAEFLLARIEEEEALARAVGERRWRVRGATSSAVVDDHGDPVVLADGAATGAHLDHIAWNDPARVLAGCAFKRLIVDDWHRLEDETSRLMTVAPPAPRALRTLAAAYADHPDYDDSWAVDRAGADAGQRPGAERSPRRCTGA